MLLNFVKDILTEAGYDVTTAPTAKESLAAAKANPPELILLDYVLPDMKGDEVTRHLREDSTTARHPGNIYVWAWCGSSSRCDGERECDWALE